MVSYLYPTLLLCIYTLVGPLLHSQQLTMKSNTNNASRRRNTLFRKANELHGSSNHHVLLMVKHGTQYYIYTSDTDVKNWKSLEDLVKIMSRQSILS